MKNRWRSSKTAKYNLGYHLIWCVKYRRKVLLNDIEVFFKKLMLEKAQEINVVIEQMEVMPDHIHIFVKAPPTYAPHFIVQQFKGYTSKFLRSNFRSLKSRLPTLWTRSYYVESVGHISESTIKKYIEDQKGK